MLAVLFGCSGNQSQTESLTTITQFREPHRLQYHFSPPAMWMNDPNGMVYYQGEYHLFYQYHPDSTVWGPMHWGHAISRDLVFWEHLPIALYPDELGMIFSGSAVVDEKNTSGLGTLDNPPMVAIFTYHDMAGEKSGRNDFQTQGIAFSLDKGRSWTKYAGNPVLANPGITDFRDPKVFWYEAGQRWIMSLAVYDHIRFYSSPNLLNWQLESSFGEGIGAHGGVWECPDLFKIKVEGSEVEKWVLLVSINPGGPNGGSATQYFIGDFDGRTFVQDKEFEQALTLESAIPQGKLYADFEQMGYAGWQATGEAFGARPAKGAYFKQERVNNYVGKQLANSFNTEGPATGTLSSAAFTINSPYIHLMVGGKNDPEKVAAQLVLEGGEIARTATGNDSQSLNWVSWDVQELQGQRAHIQLVDQSTEPLGHLLTDHIVFAPKPLDSNRREGIFIDYGTDNYAGVTWANVPKEDGRRLFMGWMSNWDYGQVVPTQGWRSAMTVPRSLRLESTPAGLRLTSLPVEELEVLRRGSYVLNAQVMAEPKLISNEAMTSATFELQLELETANGFALELSNSRDQKLLIGFDPARKEYFIDRRQSGTMRFSDRFAGIHYGPRLVEEDRHSLTLLVDVASIELFADGGKTVMTDIVFPDEPFTSIRLLPQGAGLSLQSAKFYDLQSIWQPAN